MLFACLFVVIFSSLHLNTGSGSNGNVEQWINLTNQMFYGKQDFLFSYGPMYWIAGGATSQYSVMSYWGAIGFLSSINAAVWTLILSMTLKAGSIAFLAIAFFLFFGNLVFPPSLFLWPFIVATYLDHRKSVDRPINLKQCIVLGVLAGGAIYIRYFYGLVAAATFGSYFFSCMISDRKIHLFGVFAASMVVSYLFVGLLVFHDTTSIISYVVINNQLSFGNSVDMTLDVGNTTKTWIIVALVLVALNAYVVLRKRQFFLTINILLLIFFKLGFGRADHYLNYFVSPVAMLALLAIFEKSKIGRAVFLLIMIALYYLSTTPSYINSPTRDPLRAAIDFNSSYAARMANAYPEFKLDSVMRELIGNSTVDVYPYNNEYIFANELNYRHRPLFQGYMTLTPKLDAMNQTYFESPNRPEFILWTAGISCTSARCNPFDSPDQKYSLNEDPLTTSSILLNYHVVKSGKGKGGVPLLLLRKNQFVTAYAEKFIAERNMEFGKWYLVPKVSGGLLKIKPNFKLTIYAKVKNMLFRGNVLKIKLKGQSGQIREYRLNILNASSGVTVSPLLDNIDLSGERITEIMFDTASSGYFEPEFTANWVNIAAASIVDRGYVSSDAIVNGVPAHDDQKSGVCDGSIDTVNGALITAAPLRVSDFMGVRGWLAASTQKGEIYDNIFLTFTNQAGKQIYVKTRSQIRDDVAKAFKQPPLSAAGFESQVDVSGFHGKVILGMAGMIGSVLYTCSQFQVPIQLVN